MSGEEFCAVTRKKWMVRRSLQKPWAKLRYVSDKNYDESFTVDVNKFERRLNQLCVEMSGSDYFLTAMSILSTSLSELSVRLGDLCCLVCFGIGPFTRNYQALHQLAFVLCTQQHCAINEAIFFDPILNDTEKQVLQLRQCSLMAKNCEAKYEVNKLTLFYMPHCPNALTNNLLWRNWNIAQLTKIVLINNSFENLTNSKPERLLRGDSNYILDISSFAKEFPLDDDYETPNVFNDLSIHVFPPHFLPTQSNFWTPRDAPTYPKDIELISPEEAKHNINSFSS